MVFEVEVIEQVYHGQLWFITPCKLSRPLPGCHCAWYQVKPPQHLANFETSVLIR